MAVTLTFLEHRMSASTSFPKSAPSAEICVWMYTRQVLFYTESVNSSQDQNHRKCVKPWRSVVLTRVARPANFGFKRFCSQLSPEKKVFSTQGWCTLLHRYPRFSLHVMKDGYNFHTSFSCHNVVSLERTRKTMTNFKLHWSKAIVQYTTGSWSCGAFPFLS